MSTDELFSRLCAWDDADYILGCGTKAGSDTEDTDGIVDGHAYSVLQCLSDVAGSGNDLVQVRNPWGSGEFESGEWDDDGPGWEQNPEVAQLLGHEVADDGKFWLTKQEFFQYFETLYLWVGSTPILQS